MFDILSSARFYGNSLNSAFRNRVGWGDGTNTLVIDGIQPDNSTSTTRTITLYSINNSATSATDNFNSVRINFNDYWESNLWIEYHSAEDIDYALAENVFNNVTSGLLVSENADLLDATPDGPSADDFDVAVNFDFSLPPLGVNISNISHQSTPNRIDFDLTQQ